jgi:hypothetical protein
MLPSVGCIRSRRVSDRPWLVLYVPDGKPVRVDGRYPTRDEAFDCVALLLARGRHGDAWRVEHEGDGEWGRLR